MSEWIFLYGPPGVGKSFLGRALAASLNLPFWDLDDEIVSRAGMSIPAIFSTQGEAAFRLLEEKTLREVLVGPGGVIALGGGSLLSEVNRAVAAKAGKVVSLSASPETLISRLKADENKRPLLEKSSLKSLLARRKEHYDSFSLRIATEGLSLETLMLKLQTALGRFRLTSMGEPYDVVVQNGGLNNLGQALRSRELQGTVVLVSDSNVGELYANQAAESLRAAGYSSQTVLLSPGEKNKNMNSVQKLWNTFLEAKIERGSTVVALGGGVVGDLAGFAAATFLRGVNWVNVPTSLLAMVDSSLGGKTGADLPQGKNLVGAFHAPRLVLVDPETLSTLPEVELRNGLAEVIKHGVIGAPELFRDLTDLTGFQNLSGLSGLDWTEIVRRAMAVKIKIIEEDPYEQGLRQSLNFGHTIGHAVELASDFTLRHGEAVAIGMVAEARLAEEMGVAKSGLEKKITSSLRGLGLPTEIPPGLDEKRIQHALQRDKKKSGGVVRFALPVQVGEVRVGVEVRNLPFR